ncbi:MAG: tetratricopeptide repeat protein [Candidatus Omnitrophota bacterium]
MRKYSRIIFVVVACFFLCSCERIKTSMMYLEASTAYNQGNMGKAIDIYKKLLEVKPDDPQLHWSLGAAYFTKGDLYNTRKQIVVLRKLNRQDLAEDLEQLLEE